jgi:hypothetical protein
LEGLGRIAAEEGDFAQARSYFGQVIGADPNNHRCVCMYEDKHVRGVIIGVHKCGKYGQNCVCGNTRTEEIPGSFICDE